MNRKYIFYEVCERSSMAEQNLPGAYENPYRFNAKELDRETNLYYYGARYYNPKFSIWYGVDPLAEKMPSWSPYVYTFNNPIIFTDPTGMAPDTIFKNKNTGETVEIKDGRDDVIEVGGKDFAYAKTYAAALKQPGYDSPELVDKYRDFFYDMKYGEGFSEEKISHRALDAIANDRPGDYWAFDNEQYSSDINFEPPKYYGGTIDIGFKAPAVKLFTKLGIRYTEHFAVRIAGRASRGITEAKALKALNEGRLFYNPATKNYIRHDATTKISVVIDKIKNGKVITVFEGNASPTWNAIKYRK